MTKRQPPALAAALLVAALALLAAEPASAGQIVRLGTFGAWEAYSYAERDGKLCYAAALADKTQGGTARRKGMAVAITHRPRSPGEVSLVAPFQFKQGEEAEIQIGGMKHAFFTRGDSGWAKNAAADQAIIAAMVKGREVVIHASPAMGSAAMDTVPLDGFMAALGAIDKACDIKR